MNFMKKQDQLLKTKEEFENKLKAGLSKQPLMHSSH